MDPGSGDPNSVDLPSFIPAPYPQFLDGPNRLSDLSGEKPWVGVLRDPVDLSEFQIDCVPTAVDRSRFLGCSFGLH